MSEIPGAYQSSPAVQNVQQQLEATRNASTSQQRESVNDAQASSSRRPEASRRNTPQRSISRRPSRRSSRRPASVTLSDTADAEVRRAVAEKTIEEAELLSYIVKHFAAYEEEHICDFALWEAINSDFGMFTQEIWKMVTSPVWNMVHRICYTQGFWVDHACGGNGTRYECMHRAINSEYYAEWTPKQIAFIRRQYDDISPAVQKQESENDAVETKRVSTPASALGSTSFPDPSQAPENQAFIAPSSAVSLRGEQPTNNPADQPVGNPPQQPPPQSAERSLQLPPQQPPQQLPIRNPRTSSYQDIRLGATHRERTIEEENEEQSPYDNSAQPDRTRFAQSVNNTKNRHGEKVYWTKPPSTEQVASQPQPDRSQQTIQHPVPQLQEPVAYRQILLPSDPSYRPWPPPNPQTEPAVPVSSHQQPASIPTSASVAYSHELTQLDKVYKNEDKFQGTGDNFDFKLAIFYDRCSRHGLPPDQYIRAASIMLSGQALTFFYTNRELMTTWDGFITATRNYFEGPEWQRMNLAKWQTIHLNEVIAANPTFSTSECLTKLVTDINMLHRGIGPSMAGSYHLRENIIRAVRGHPALLGGLANPPSDVSGLVNSLHTSIVNYEAVHKTPRQGTYLQSYNEEEDSGEEEAYFTDRHYRGGRPTFRGRGKSYGRSRGAYTRSTPRSPFSGPKKCFVCDKVGCWSTNHTTAEREAAMKKWMNERPNFRTNRPGYEKAMQRFIMEYEGSEMDEVDQYFEELIIDATKDEAYIMQPERLEKPRLDQQFFTSVGALGFSESLATTELLANNAFKHRISMNDETAPAPDPTPYVYNSITESRYDSTEFKGLLIDSGAAGSSTAGIGQLQALQKLDDSVHLDASTAGSGNFTFGIGSTSTIGTINLMTPMGSVIFHIVPIYTPFLLCLADMDKLGVFLNNVTNHMVQADRSHPVFRRYGHAFLLWHTAPYALITESLDTNPCYLTVEELRRLHRRFGHPSVRRLQNILDRAGHEVDTHALRHLTKYCEHCQKHGRPPGRFSFTIKDDVDFNFNVIVDILYVIGKPVLHVVDEATRFQAGRWLKDISAKHLWEQLRACWIDVYLGPPDFISADSGKQFVAQEFKQYAINMGITVKNVPVEAHHSIGQVERYHGPLRRAYSIITEEIPGIEPELGLQMAFKAINDSVGPNGLIPTLLVFGAYPRMTEMDAPSPTITQRATAMRRAMDEVKKLNATRQVNDALNTRNGPSTVSVRDLPINSPVLVYREGNTGRAGAWRGPYKLLGLESETAIVEINGRPARFRITSIKPFHVEETPATYEPPVQNGEMKIFPPKGAVLDDPENEANDGPPVTEDEAEDDENVKNQSGAEDATHSESTRNESATSPQPIKRGRGRPRKYPIQVNFTSLPISKCTADPDLCFMIERRDSNQTESHLPAPTESHLLASTESYLPAPNFTASRQKEIAGLLEKGCFKLTNRNEIPPGTRVFNSRFVDEIKNRGTEKAFEKSRLVVQAYNDLNKGLVLTQSPTIQRMSQRVILCLAVVLGGEKVKLYLRDVTQAYVQSTSDLNRDFYINPPTELIKALDSTENCVLKVVKPLYGVPEAGNHWFATYHRHHTERLGMIESTYDPCLLHSTKPFGIVGLQTDDTLILASNEFAIMEEKAIKEAKIMTKQRDRLAIASHLKFNGMRIELTEDGSINMIPAYQHGISLVKNQDASSISSRGMIREKLTPKEQFIAQRARGAYVACICQPEASFDLSYAAQSTVVTTDDIALLNKRLKWQIDNRSKGLKYVKLDPNSLQLVIFTDSSFANNRDMSSQIGYIVCLTDATARANILHWSSTKCKRVTRSVLASELYAMAHGSDTGAVLKATIGKIMETDIPLVICTDSKSLWECLVKLGTTQEKRLMIDVMCLRQSYERREITEIRWIEGEDNPADHMTKSRPSTALKRLVDSNEINLKAAGWVERSSGPSDGAKKGDMGP